VSAARRPSAEEIQLVQQAKAKLEAELLRKRSRGAVFFAVMLIAALLIGSNDLELIAYSIGGVGVIALLQALSAHSHLQVVRERKATALFPDFSVLGPTRESDVDMAARKQ
jgi:hypothetical protein